MGRFVTPRGVVLTTSDVAARAVGYRPVDEPKKKPARKSAKKDDAQSSDDK